MISKAMYVEYCGPYAREAKAIAVWESHPPGTMQEDPYALSPGGLSMGMMQQSLEWQRTYPPSRALISARLYEWAMLAGATHPAYQLACYATFAHKNAQLDMAGRLRLYHYGHQTIDDPDRYVDRVLEVWNELGDW